MHEAIIMCGPGKDIKAGLAKEAKFTLVSIPKT
jgi:hypothetical protein